MIGHLITIRVNDDHILRADIFFSCTVISELVVFLKITTTSYAKYTILGTSQANA